MVRSCICCPVNEIYICEVGWTSFFSVFISFLFHCMHACSVASNSLRPPWTVTCRISVHGTEVLCPPTTRGSSQPRDRTWVSCIVGKFFTTELPGKSIFTFIHPDLEGRFSSYKNNNLTTGRWYTISYFLQTLWHY